MIFQLVFVGGLYAGIYLDQNYRVSYLTEFLSNYEVTYYAICGMVSEPLSEVNSHNMHTEGCLYIDLCKLDHSGY